MVGVGKNLSPCPLPLRREGGERREGDTGGKVRRSTKTEQNRSESLVLMIEENAAVRFAAFGYLQLFGHV